MSKRLLWWTISVTVIAAIVLGLGLQMAARSDGTVYSWGPGMMGAYGVPVGNSENGRGIAQAKCASCHGLDGNSPNSQFPKLAGQDPSYLYWQLRAFKTGTRRSEIMVEIAATLSDADAADATSFYGRQTTRPDHVKDRALAFIGERIFVAAGGPGMLPSCAMCHATGGQRGMMSGRMPMMGMMGSGMMGNVPNLNGQHATYLIDQLNRYARGERQGMMMNRIAATLSEADKKAVAEYLSGLP